LLLLALLQTNPYLFESLLLSRILKSVEEEIIADVLKISKLFSLLSFFAAEFKNAIGCHSEVVQLKCNRSSRLAIYSANFGRTEYESVQCPQPNGVHEECE
jgi:hypothetical protein